MGRAVVTNETKEVSEKLLGYIINAYELRLMTYVFDRAIFSNKIPAKDLSPSYKELLGNWETKGFLKTERQQDGSLKFWLTIDFYKAMTEIFLVSYVKEAIMQ